MQVYRSDKGNKRPQRREAFFVLISDNDGQPTFVNVTEHLGKAMPFAKPTATCAMRVSPDVVAFSILTMTKRSAKRLSDAELSVPREVLARLERRAPRLDIPASRLVVEILLPVEAPQSAPHASEEAELAGLMNVADGAASTRPELKTVTWSFNVDRDDAGIVDLIADTDSEGGIEMPKGAVKASLYLGSPTAERKLAISFIGHLPGRPGALESPARIAGQILSVMTQLPEFRFLAHIEGVRLAARPSGVWIRPQAPKVEVAMPVALFNTTDDEAPFANGSVHVEVDMTNARERLLLHITPSRELEGDFERFRPIVTQYAAQTIDAALGPDAVRHAVMEIMLSEVSSGTIEDLQNAVAVLAGGAFFTPSNSAPMTA